MKTKRHLAEKASASAILKDLKLPKKEFERLNRIIKMIGKHEVKMSNEKMLIENSLLWLGVEVKDRYTQFTGVITSISFDVSGCIQGFVRPTELKDGKMADGYWLDISRLKVISPREINPVFLGVVSPEVAHGPENKSDPFLNSNK